MAKNVYRNTEMKILFNMDFNDVKLKSIWRQCAGKTHCVPPKNNSGNSRMPRDWNQVLAYLYVLCSAFWNKLALWWLGRLAATAC